MYKPNFQLIFFTLFTISLAGQQRFKDDFEDDLSGWIITNERSVRLIDTKDDRHNFVMALSPDGNISALIKDSHQWGALRVKGEMYFPENTDNYLGFIYNYQKNEIREDFGALYVKGNGSYIRANPWRDGNVSRLLYEEYKTALKDDQAITIGKWHKFKMEVVKNKTHLYVGDMAIPKITFNLFELDSGKVGFQPRVVGGDVWIDNVEVSSIEQFSYQGDEIPSIAYKPEMLMTKWEVLGPFRKPSAQTERSFFKKQGKIDVDGKAYSWIPFEVDNRGAVITGRITQYEGEKTVAYFRTFIEVPEEKKVKIHFTSTDELALYVNGRDYGRVYRDGYLWPDNDWNAWYDFWENPKHSGSKEEIPLKKGANQLIIRVRNGQFASGGFFAYLEDQ